jgi:ubiquinone/menaquinone biosynthesis C-methylase UbiE
MKLDVGCGANKVSDSIGVDLYKTDAVDVVASALNLPFKDDSFTEVFSRRCIQHIGADQKALKEMHRVLEPDGKATVIVASWRGWLYYKVKWMFRKKPYALFNYYSKTALIRKMGDAGFSKVTVNAVKSTRKFGYDILAEANK